MGRLSPACFGWSVKQIKKRPNGRSGASVRLRLTVKPEQYWRIPLRSGEGSGAGAKDGVQFTRRVEIEGTPPLRLSLLRSVTDARLRGNASFWGR